MELEQVRRFAGREHGLATVATTRADGSIQVTVVNAALLPHPVSGDEVVGLVARGEARKLRHLRERPATAVTFRVGWEWATVEGEAELFGPDDRLPDDHPERLRILLREVFVAAGGDHDDFDEYDRVMAEERRCVVLVQPDRIYGVER